MCVALVPLRSDKVTTASELGLLKRCSSREMKHHENFCTPERVAVKREKWSFVAGNVNGTERQRQKEKRDEEEKSNGDPRRRRKTEEIEEIRDKYSE